MRRLTQEELVAEAKITEAKNTASLAHFLKLEEEKKKVKVTKVKISNIYYGQKNGDHNVLGLVSDEFACFLGYNEIFLVIE